MRILYITNYYPPEIAAGASRVSELAYYWVRQGHDVTVVTGYPNHPSGRVPAEYGRRYWWRSSRDVREGVQVVRVPLLPAPNRGTVRRCLHFATLAASSSLTGVILPRPDIVIATSPQLLNVLPALILQKLRQVPWIFEIRDLWPEQLVGVGYKGNSPLVLGLRRLVRHAYDRSDHIVTVSPAFAPILRDQYNINPAKITLLPNGVDSTRFNPQTPPLRERFGLLASHFVVGFIGTLGLSQRFEPVLEAAAILRHSAPDIQFLIIGDGANRSAIADSIRAKQLSNVHLFGLQPRDLMPGILAGLNVALVLLSDNNYFRVALPSKMLEILSMERPVILLAEGVAADLLQQAKAGIAVADGPELIAAIMHLCDQPQSARCLGRNGREFVQRHYERQALAMEYLQLMQRLLDSDRSVRSAAITAAL